MKAVGKLLRVVGDVAYAINDRGPEKPSRFLWLEAVEDFCYRNARKMGARVEWGGKR